MSEREDPRIPLIAAVLAIGETPAGRMLCERFLAEAAGLEGVPGPIPAAQLRAVVSPSVANAIEGIATNLSMAADHAALLAQEAKGVTRPPPRPWPPED